MQKYTWCIPSVTMWKKAGSLKGGLPDVSLFDHSKQPVQLPAVSIRCMLKKTRRKTNMLKNILMIKH